jgi:hypothetical protein
MVKIKKIKEVTERSSAIMGRPKIANPKTEIGRVRLTESEMKKIKKSHKTFSAFVRAMIKTLPLAVLLTLASCGQDGRDLYPGETIGSSTMVYQGSLLSYSCNGDLCWIAGSINNEEIKTAEMAFTGNIYYNGQICTISGCLDYKFAPSLKTLDRIYL